MKGKPTWKPVGLNAKKWRAAGQVGSPAKLFPAPVRNEPWRKRTEKRVPSVPQAA